ncbi:MAG: hypothetical protein HC888_02920 [Candidatus Competibacteraceae bacterium]|nr:hypothetical protein [Candidatus Competibacteraceae bacterium]
MKIIAYILSVYFVLGFAEAETLKQIRTFNYRGIHYVTSIPIDCPSNATWTPGLNEPPLSNNQAYKIANTEFKKTFSQYNSFELQGVTLTRHGEGWLYYVTYLQKTEDFKKYPPSPKALEEMKPLVIVYYITLDGQIYSPQRESKPE